MRQTLFINFCMALSIHETLVATDINQQTHRPMHANNQEFRLTGRQAGRQTDRQANNLFMNALSDTGPCIVYQSFLLPR
jgi:hypothetical protein